jgi:peptide/nickel transport system ATP-binding protein
LSCNPALLIADEPTTGLDVTIQAQVLDLMLDLNRKTGTAILLISHDLGVISEMSDEIAVMYSGNIVESADMEAFFTSHKHPYSEGLLKSIPQIGETKGLLTAIPGSVPNMNDPPSGCRFHPRCPYALDRCRKEKPGLKEVFHRHKVACFKVNG